MSDLMTSIARDWAGKAVGGAVGLALAAGVVVPAEMSEELTLLLAAAIIAAAQMVYYVAVRMLEQRWPGLGRLLGVARAPGYGVDMPVNLVPVVDHEAMVTNIANVRDHLRQVLQEERQRARPSGVSRLH